MNLLWLAGLLRGASPDLLGPATSIDINRVRARATVVAGRVRSLAADVNAASNPAKQSRDRIKSETGVDVFRKDPNPYFQQDNEPKLAAILLAAEVQEEEPATVHALWMKEATTQVLGDWMSPAGVASEERARSLFIADSYYRFLGADVFTAFTPATRRGQDNRILIQDSTADDHRAVLDAASKSLHAEYAAKYDYAPILRNELTVTRVGDQFNVKAGDSHHFATIALTMALFRRIRRNPVPAIQDLGITYPLSDDMAYIVYNSGPGGPGIKDRGAHAVFDSARQRAATSGKSISDELFRTQIPSSNTIRRNAVKFMHYRMSYAPLYA